VTVSRTTIMASDILMNRVKEQVGRTGEDLTDFYNRAIINQLERDGDFEVRDLWEEDTNGSCEKQN
jgi:hypothetical protein